MKCIQSLQKIIFDESWLRSGSDYVTHCISLVAKWCGGVQQGITSFLSTVQNHYISVHLISLLFVVAKYFVQSPVSKMRSLSHITDLRSLSHITDLKIFFIKFPITCKIIVFPRTREILSRLMLLE